MLKYTYRPLHDRPLYERPLYKGLHKYMHTHYIGTHTSYIERYIGYIYTPYRTLYKALHKYMHTHPRVYRALYKDTRTLHWTLYIGYI